MSDRTCFFITPIGKKDSMIYFHSNIVLRSLRTAFIAFGREIIRADEGVAPFLRNNMLDQIKNAEVCVIDLTGMNVNVIWEFGFRFGVESTHSVTSWILIYNEDYYSIHPRKKSQTSFSI